MINLRDLDDLHPENQVIFLQTFPLLLAKNSRNEELARILLNISFLAKKISRSGFQTILVDLDIPCCKQDARLMSLKQILVQSQHRLTFSQNERDVFGALHSLLTHNPEFIEYVAQEELSGSVRLPVLTSIHPIVNLPSAGEYAPSKTVKTEAWFQSHTMALSPDGKFLAVADEELEIWDMESGKKVLSTLPNGHISCLNFSPDGEKLLATTTDGKDTIWWDKPGNFLSIWGMSCQAWVLTLDVHSASINKGFFNPDGNMIYSASDDQSILCLDSDTGHILRRFLPNIPVKDCVCSETGKVLYFIGEDAILQAWDSESGIWLFSLISEHGKITKMAISNDGNILVTIYSDGSLGVWDVLGKCELFNLSIENATAKDALISVEANCILSVFSDNSIRIWGLDSGELRGSLIYTYLIPSQCHMNLKGDCVILFANQWIHFWEAGRLLEIQGNHVVDKERYVQNIYNQGGNKTVQHFLHISSCYFLGDGKFVAVDGDRKIKIWDSRNGQIFKVLEESQETILCTLSRDSSLLMSIDSTIVDNEGNKVRIWNSKDFSLKTTWLLTAQKKFPSTLSVSRDGKVCLTGFNGGLIEMRELATGRLKYQIYRHEYEAKQAEQARTFGLPPHRDILQCAISPGNEYFASIAKYDPNILISDLSSGELICVLNIENMHSYEFIEFTADSKKFLAVGMLKTSDGESKEYRLQLWDVPGFVVSEQVSLGKLDSRYSIASSALDPESQFIALVYFGGQIGIWDVIRGDRIAWMILDDFLGSCAWSNDKILMIGGKKGAYFLWLVTDALQWRRFGRGIFDTGYYYQSRLHFFGDGITFEANYQEILTGFRTEKLQPVIESIVFKSEVAVIANQGNSAAIIYNNAGVSLAYLKEFKTAQVFFQKISDADFYNLSEYEKGIISFNHGYLEYLLKEYQLSKSTLQKALNIFEILGQKSWQAKTLDAIGTVLYNLQEYDESITSYLRSMSLYEKCRSWNQATELKEKISYVYRQLNDIEQSVKWKTSYFCDLRNQR